MKLGLLEAELADGFSVIRSSKPSGRWIRGVPEALWASAVTTLGSKLPEEDRVMLEATIVRREPVCHVARRTNISRSALRRKIARVLSRMLTKDFYYVSRGGLGLEQLDHNIAEACIIRGESLRACAKEYNITLARVRSAMVRIKGKIAAARVREEKRKAA